MKLVCISDTHSYHQYVDDIPDGDVLIFRRGLYRPLF